MFACHQVATLLKTGFTRLKSEHTRGSWENSDKVLELKAFWEWLLFLERLGPIEKENSCL
jgi:hypothetical protein